MVSSAEVRRHDPGVNEQTEQPLTQLATAMTADYTVLLEPGMIARLVLLVALFVVSAFFSGSETALFSLSRLDLRRLRRERHPKVDLLYALLDQPRRLIISILCGNQVVNVAAAANLTGILVAVYGVERAAWISTVLMVPLLLLFGEATPKTIAVSDPVGVSTRIVARPMHLWVNLITPLSHAIRHIADRITTAFVGAEKASDNLLQVDEFRTLVDEGVVAGELTATERALIYNLLHAGSAEIIEIMTPRTRMACIDGNLPLTRVVAEFVRFRHNCVPVYRGRRDNVVGFLYADDVMRLVVDNDDLTALSLDDVMQPPVMVPATKKIDEMFDYFQAHGVEAVAVLDEFGGVDGFLTINDVLTNIFGRTQAEIARPDITRDEAAGIIDIPGDMTLIDFNRLTNLGLDDSRMTTIAGVVLRHLDRLPAVGDEVTIDPLTLRVLEMDDNRIARLRVASHDTRPEFRGSDAPPAQGAQEE